MSNEMIERVAKAIAKQQGYGTVINYNVWWDQAKAAIEAMREPTEGMLNNMIYEDGITNWKAGIDAALKE